VALYVVVIWAVAAHALTVSVLAGAGAIFFMASDALNVSSK
jgi:hypothetical protein